MKSSGRSILRTTRLDGLVNYFCKYAQEYFAMAGCAVSIGDSGQICQRTPISPEVRHNVFLASKESVTNVVKHAQASCGLQFGCALNPAHFTLEIEDNGRGPGGVEQKTAAVQKWIA